MDTEDLGRKLLLTLSGDPCRTPEMQTVGTVTASHKVLTLQALSSSLNAGAAKWGCLGRGEALGALRQSVPQTGHVHLHKKEKSRVWGHWRNTVSRVLLWKRDSVSSVANSVSCAKKKIGEFVLAH